jgi:hypothetical protein
MASPASSDETIALSATIGLKTPLTNYDIAYVNILQRKFYLAHRDIGGLEIVNIDTLARTQSPSIFTNGPNGVWTVNESQVWAGDANSTIRVLDANGNQITTINTKGKGRVDEGCFDPADQLVVAINNQESPYQWMNFIPTSGPDAYTVTKKIQMDGLTNNSVHATNGLEQCVWSPFTGKIYQDVPEVGGPGNDSRADRSRRRGRARN